MNYSKAIKDVKNALLLWHVWFYHAYHQISSKYKRTFLGSLWISASMVTTSLSLAIVFGGIFGQSLKESLPFIMSGILCFGIAGFPITEGQETLMANAGIIKNHAYPFTFYVFEAVSRSLMMFLHNLVIFYITMAIVGSLAVPHYTIIFAIPIIILYMCFLTMITSMLAARFRDLRFLLQYIGQLMSFLTPVFWHPNQLTGWRKLIVDLNPLYGILEILRSPLTGHPAPKVAWILAIVSVCVGAIIWLIAFPRFRKRIPYWV